MVSYLQQSCKECLVVCLLVKTPNMFRTQSQQPQQQSNPPAPKALDETLEAIQSAMNQTRAYEYLLFIFAALIIWMMPTSR